MLSIIIPTMKDNIPYLKACVESIKKYATNDNYEIIVVSNPDPIYDIDIDGIRRLHSPEQGQCRAVNLGVREAKGEYILISDDDVIFPKNWEDLVEKAKEVEFLSGNFVESGVKGGVAAPFITKDFGNTPDEFKWEEWENNDLAEDKWEDGFGFPLICKKEFWEKIEGYDEEYDPWGSNCDSDLEYKVMLAGVMPRRWRGAPTYHFGQVSGIFTREEADPYLQKNKTYFERKWGIRRADCPDIWYCNFIIDGEGLKYKPDWMKDDLVYYNNFSLRHVGWVTANPGLFERFWCQLMGFKKVWESRLSREMCQTLFDIDDEATCRRYEGHGTTIETHHFDKEISSERYPYNRFGIHHICLNVDDRIKLLKKYPFEKRIYNNPAGHQNIFIRDFEGNWVELYTQV